MILTATKDAREGGDGQNHPDAGECKNNDAGDDVNTHNLHTTTTAGTPKP